MSLIVYGIPTCSTVTTARRWLTAHGFEHEFVDFRAHPPDRAAVASWVRQFGAQAMKNTSGGAYRELGAEKDRWTEEQWTEAFFANPMLIRRPLVTRDGAPILVGWKYGEADLMVLLAR